MTGAEMMVKERMAQRMREAETARAAAAVATTGGGKEGGRARGFAADLASVFARIRARRTSTVVHATPAR